MLINIIFAILAIKRIKNSEIMKPTDHSDSLNTQTNPIYMNKNPSTA